MSRITASLFVRLRVRRLLTAVFVVLFAILLWSMDGLRFFSLEAARGEILFLPAFHFGLTSLVGALFLAVGTLVWFYARNRPAALLLFAFCSVMMVTFVVQTGAQLNDPFLSALGDTGGVLSILLFALLALVFPHNHLHWTRLPGQHSPPEEQFPAVSRQTWFVRLYAVALTLLALAAIAQGVAQYVPGVLVPDATNVVFLGFYLVAIVGIFCTFLLPAFRKQAREPASSRKRLRERLQTRFLMGSVVLAFAPLLFLTIIPGLLPIPQQFVMDGQYSAITLAVFPILLGYAILRYQLFILDRYIRNFVAGIVEFFGLAIVAYAVALCAMVISSSLILSVIAAVLGVVVLHWIIRKASVTLTDHLFFSEMLYNRRILDAQPAPLARETVSLAEAAGAFTLAIFTTLETQEVSLLLLDAMGGFFRHIAVSKQDEEGETPGYQLAQRVINASRRISANKMGWLTGDDSIVQRVSAASLPLLLSEASEESEEPRVGWQRYLATRTALDGSDPILFAVWAQGKIIGLLVLGERGDALSYAGSDFEAILHLIDRYSLVLETARVKEQSDRHVTLLDTLYRASTSLGLTFESVQAVTEAIATGAASAAGTRAEIWLLGEPGASAETMPTPMLLPTFVTGRGPKLTMLDRLELKRTDDWDTRFYQGTSGQLGYGRSLRAVPFCLPEVPDFPFAWLPLARGQRRLGVLVLTYALPRLFSEEEMRAWGMFADHCAAVVQTTQAAIEVRSAYERLQELDIAKNRFIMTASHELRTPLTSVNGYLELLLDYGSKMSFEQQTAFLESALRGCAELGEIMNQVVDASRLDFEATHIHLTPLSLTFTVMRALDKLRARITIEERPVRVEIPEGLMVLADSVCLHQVLMNLLTNALQYSRAKSPIEITCEIQTKEVAIHVRDYGLGVPPQDHERLFERFERLERDINSTERGAGLGLYIGRKLVEAMGGNIRVESTGQCGEGSCFTFTLVHAGAEIVSRYNKAIEEENTGNV